MKAIVVGRDKDKCNYVVDDPFISRTHVQIVEKDDGSYTLFDLESSTGTFVNGKRISKETTINKDDIIKIGNTVLKWNMYFSDNPVQQRVSSPGDRTRIENVSTPNYNAPNKEQSYASFGERLGAIIIDAIVLFVIFTLMAFIAAAYIDNNYYVDKDEVYGIMYFVFIVFSWLYFAISESSKYQGTLGKRLVKIEVTDMGGNRISFGQATGRYLGKIISQLILYIGYLMVLWTDKKQALHDQMSGCLVLKKEAK
jgi:uncharacterized RDD family membrane protein YckC